MPLSNILIKYPFPTGPINIIKYGGIQVNEKFEQTFPSITNGAKIEDGDNHCSSEELGNEVCANVKIFTCSECNKKCKTKGGLKLHINKLHSGTEMFRCSKCSFESYSKYKFDHHILIHSDKKNYPCCKCDKKFSRKRNLQWHMLVHSDNKNFQCCKCDWKFSRKSYLRRHMLVHSDKKFYKCNECGHEFKQKGNLKSHLLLHSVNIWLY
ncbi:Gastrula zinc finger protein XlCGF7.1 [Armadillidium vulgare]|nr:Gastrula zinc finger protein XlCGF7.1 [Armadillidium vulgare]